jgi:preprotein translocase subunit YajC
MTPLDLLMIGAVVASFWLLIVRPARARREAQAAVVASLAPGRRVLTAGGLFGTVVAVEQGLLRLEVAPGVTIEMLPEAVGQVLDQPSASGDWDVDAGDAAASVGSAADAATSDVVASDAPATSVGPMRAEATTPGEHPVDVERGARAADQRTGESHAGRPHHDTERVARHG